ncbi:DUF2806 domain-containing protein [Chryseobacterium gambrini]|uniref:DUF2806 domain-containing protein n=1 Tax=Chryseobacterium gambrini TaxID=373672 RepID=UPI0022F3AEEC|nr:DUF2806 domain-containing protein [Chryseobacterium gambrini]WBX98368.1 DUF2806 domain-containing protein [Chryseobacterium gambrini]
MESNEMLGELQNAVYAINENVPADVKAGFFKALSRFGSALLEIPIAKLEGVAQEIRSTNQSREKLIGLVSESIGSKIETAKDYSDFAVRNYSKKILREQLNIDAVSTVAANELNSANYSNYNIPRSEISDEWLDEFESICRNKSSEDMRTIFGKILAKEIINPDKVSLKTLRVVSQLEKNTAEYFLEFAKICIYLKDSDGNIQSVLAPGFTSGPFKVYDFSCFNISPTCIIILDEFGLINDTKEYEIPFMPKSSNSQKNYIQEFWIGNSKFSIEKTNALSKDKLSMGGKILSSAGVDLFSILSVEPNMNLLTRLTDYFSKENFKLIRE